MGSRYTTIIGHLEKKSPLQVGQTVIQGDHIGRMGSSGKSTAPHLHLGLIDGLRSKVFRMAEILLSKKLLRQLAYFLMDTELFRFKNKVTYSFGDPKYLDDDGKLIDHMGYDVVPEDRHKKDYNGNLLKDHYDMYWPRSKKGTVTYNGKDPGYGWCVLITYES